MELVRTLYKFTSLREDFVKNRYLRLTPRSELNDPFDTYPFPSDIREIVASIKASKRRLKVSATTVRRDYFSGIGIISLTESIRNALMWAHYGDSHKGMAIGVKREHPFWKGSLGRVRYTTQRPALRTRYPNVRGAELWFKSDQWMYEKEWRLIRPLQEADILLHHGVGPISVKKLRLPCVYPYLAMIATPSDAIESITLGARVQSKDIRKLRLLIASEPSLKHVELRQVNLDKNRYELSITQV